MFDDLLYFIRGHLKAWGLVYKLTALILFTNVFAVVLEAYVASYLWQWFVVAIFNLPVLSFFQALALVLLIKFVHHTNTYGINENKPAVNSNSRDEKAVAILSLSLKVMTPLWFLFVGYVLSYLV